MESEEVRRMEGRSRGGRLRGGKVGGKRVHADTSESNKKRTFGRRVAEQFSSFYRLRVSRERRRAGMGK